MPLSFDELVGFLVIVLEHIRKHRAELRKGMIDPDAMYAKLKKVKDGLVKLNAKQERLKRDLSGTTAKLEKQSHEAYTIGSGFVDMMSGAYRKDSIAAKDLRRVRAVLHRRRKREEPPPSG